MAGKKEVKYAHRLPPCPDYDTEGVESWLTDLAREGLLLDHDNPFWGFYSFIHTAPQVVKYRLEPAVKPQSFWDGDPGRPKDEDVAIHEEMGWEYITRYGEFFIYRSSDPNARELHTDPGIQAAALNVIKKRQRSEFISQIIIVTLYALLGLLRYPMGLAIALGTPAMVVIYLFFLMMLIRPALSFYHLRKIRKKILRGDPVNQKKDWKSGAWRKRILTLVPEIMGIYFLCVSCSAGIIADANEIKLTDYESDPPFVTIADLNPDGEYIMDNFLSYNTIREWSDILFPVNFDYDENASIEMPDGDVLSGTLILTYHEAHSPALAQQLAKELIHYAGRGKNSTPAEPLDTGYDQVTAYTYSNKYRIQKILMVYENRLVEASVSIDDYEGNSAGDEWIQLMANKLISE